MTITRRVVASFGVTMGSLLLGTWAVLFVTGKVHYGSNRDELIFLLAA